MSSYNRYYCSSCYNVWDEDQYVPKILNCGHSYCLKCLKRLFNNNQIICPEDMQTQRINSLMQLKTNEELLHPQPERIIQSSQQQQSQRSYQNISVHDSSYETVTQSTTRINKYNETNIKKTAFPSMQKFNSLVINVYSYDFILLPTNLNQIFIINSLILYLFLYYQSEFNKLGFGQFLFNQQLEK